jgi:hypothetical protein
MKGMLSRRRVDDLLGYDDEICGVIINSQFRQAMCVQASLFSS